MSMQPMGEPTPAPKAPVGKQTFDPNSASQRFKIRSGQVDPWETNRYQRSKSGKYEIQNDPNRSVNQNIEATEQQGALAFDERHRRLVDQVQLDEASALQQTTIGAWARQKTQQEEEFAKLYADTQAAQPGPYKIPEYTGAIPWNTGNGWSYQMLETSGAGEIRRTIVNAAVSAVNAGYQYSWGGGGAKGPSYGVNGIDPDDGKRYYGASQIGFDCSGLVQYAYARAGISIPRHSKAQSAYGKIVPWQQLKPGDVVSWGKSPQAAYHVAVYIGNGYVAEAANPETDMNIRKIGSWPMDKDVFGVSVSRLGR